MSQLETLEIRCPFCSDDTVVKHGLDNSQTKQRYICRNPECGRNFFVTLTDTPQIVIPERKGKKAKSLKIEANCPKCGSTNLRRDGRKDSRQIYRCKDCNRKFVFPSLKTEYAQLIQQVKQTAKTKMMSNRVIYLSHLTVDSCLGIPCFISCEVPDCEPEFCEELSKILQSPSIHKYVEFHQEFELENSSDLAYGRND